MRRLKIGFLIIVLLAVFASCSSDTAWRRSTVATFELVGAGLGTTQTVTDILKSQGAITDAQVAQVKAVYIKAKGIYTLAGQTLKLAGQAESASKRDALLAEYDKLLAEFNKLAVEITNLIASWKKKVSLDEVKMWIAEGGDA